MPFRNTAEYHVEWQIFRFINLYGGKCRGMGHNMAAWWTQKWNEMPVANGGSQPL